MKRSCRAHIALRPAEFEVIRDAADKAGMLVSEWMRDAAVRAAREQQEQRARRLENS